MRHLELKIGTRSADRVRARKASRRALAPTFARRAHEGGLDRLLKRMTSGRWQQV